MKRILICDRLLKDKPHSDWKEGWEMFYAFNHIGIECDIAGPDCPISETRIPIIQNMYDFIIVTENHFYDSPGWKWWQWKDIKIPKMFWAIDTHSLDFTHWLIDCKFDYVGLNNKNDLDKYTQFKSFYFPYGISSKRYSRNLSLKKEYDIIFIGALNEERNRYINQFNIKHIESYGFDYIKEMQKSKICFNKSVSYDLNAKYFEIMASGTFMLSNFNPVLLDFLGNPTFVENMMYKTDEELKQKIDYYMIHEEEREDLAQTARNFILSNHSYESRCKFLIEKVIKELQ